MKPIQLLPFALYALSVQAAMVPNGSSYDQHVQTVMYNPDDVVRIKTRVGVATLIQFNKDEAIDENSLVGMGDADAWKVSAKRNNILLKPTSLKPDTNFTVVTSKRTYLFSLETASKTLPVTYVVRFNYPEKETPQPTETLPCSSGQKNSEYFKSGDLELAPAEAWDDGRFACFRFPKSTDLPQVYRLMADGSEVLVNTHMQGDLMVVHEVAAEYRFRLGRRVLAIETPNLVPAPFNQKGTTTNQQRVVNHE